MTRQQIAWIFAGVVALAVSPVLVAQVLGGAGGAAATSGGQNVNEVLPALVFGWLSSTGLEWVKQNKRIVVFTEDTAWWTQRAIAIALAAATSLGIHVSFEPAGGVLTITGLMWPSIREAVWETLRQFVLQEYMYRTAVAGHVGGTK